MARYTGQVEAINCSVVVIGNRKTKTSLKLRKKNGQIVPGQATATTVTLNAKRGRFYHNQQ